MSDRRLREFKSHDLWSLYSSYLPRYGLPGTLLSEIQILDKSRYTILGHTRNKKGGTSWRKVSRIITKHYPSWHFVLKKPLTVLHWRGDIPLLGADEKCRKSWDFHVKNAIFERSFLDGSQHSIEWYSHCTNNWSTTHSIRLLFSFENFEILSQSLPIYKKSHTWL